MVTMSFQVPTDKFVVPETRPFRPTKPLPATFRPQYNRTKVSVIHISRAHDQRDADAPPVKSSDRRLFYCEP